MVKKQDGRIDEKQIEWLKKRDRPEDVKSLLQEITKAVLERGFPQAIENVFSERAGAVMCRASNTQQLELWT